MQEPVTQFRGANFLIVAAALVIVVAGLRAVKAIALPLVIAVFLAVLSTPLVTWLLRHRVPKLLSVAAAMLANVAVVVAMVFLVGGSVRALADSVPGYQKRLELEVRDGLEWLDRRGVRFETARLGWLEELLRRTEEAALDELDEPDELPAAGDEAVGPGSEPEATAPTPGLIDIGGLVDAVIGTVVAFITTTLRGLAEFMTMTLLIFILLVFMLFEATALPRKLQLAFGWRQQELARMTRARQEIQRYLVIKTLMSLLVGGVITGWVWLVGLEYPQLWGLIAFLLHYIPNIGAFIAAIPAVILALIVMGPGKALILALGYAVVNFVLGNFLEPHVMGRRLGLSTLVVVLSLVFWGWVWGPIGMLLSVPLTMILKIVLENTNDLRWVAQLIGVGPLPDPGGADRREAEAA